MEKTPEKYSGHAAMFLMFKQKVAGVDTLLVEQGKRDLRVEELEAANEALENERQKENEDEKPDMCDVSFQYDPSFLSTSTKSTQCKTIATKQVGVQFGPSTKCMDTQTFIATLVDTAVQTAKPRQCRDASCQTVEEKKVKPLPIVNLDFLDDEEEEPTKPKPIPILGLGLEDLIPERPKNVKFLSPFFFHREPPSVPAVPPSYFPPMAHNGKTVVPNADEIDLTAIVAGVRRKKSKAAKKKTDESRKRKKDEDEVDTKLKKRKKAEKKAEKQKKTKAGMVEDASTSRESFPFSPSTVNPMASPPVVEMADTTAKEPNSPNIEYIRLGGKKESPKKPIDFNALSQRIARSDSTSKAKSAIPPKATRIFGRLPASLMQEQPVTKQKRSESTAPIRRLPSDSSAVKNESPALVKRESSGTPPIRRMTSGSSEQASPVSVKRISSGASGQVAAVKRMSSATSIEPLSPAPMKRVSSGASADSVVWTVDSPAPVRRMSSASSSGASVLRTTSMSSACSTPRSVDAQETPADPPRQVDSNSGTRIQVAPIERVEMMSPARDSHKKNNPSQSDSAKLIEEKSYEAYIEASQTAEDLAMSDDDDQMDTNDTTQEFEDTTAEKTSELTSKADVEKTVGLEREKHPLGTGSKMFFLEDIIDTYEKSHKEKVMVVEALKKNKKKSYLREVVIKIIQIQLAKLWKTCTETTFNEIVTNLSKSDVLKHTRILLDCFYVAVKNEKPCEDIDLLIVPHLTKKQQKLIALLDALGQVEETKTIADEFLNYLYYSIFGRDRLYNLKLFQAQNVIRMYLAVCRLLGDDARARTFIYDFLFFRSPRNHVVMVILIHTWPELLMWTREDKRLDPVFETVIWMIYNTGPATSQQDMKVNEARRMLEKICGYPAPNLTAIEHVKNLIQGVLTYPFDAILRSSTTKALLLLAKTNEYRWANNNIVHRLLDVLSKHYPMKDDVSRTLLEWVIATIGNVSRVFPADGREQLMAMYNPVTKILVSSGEEMTESLQNVCIVAVVWLGHHLQQQVAEFLTEWRPSFPLDADALRALRNFVGTRGQKHSKITLAVRKKRKIKGV